MFGTGENFTNSMHFHHHVSVTSAVHPDPYLKSNVGYFRQSKSATA
jgi:hypothetical protein